jgi:hypothetical protein
MNTSRRVALYLRVSTDTLPNHRPFELREYADHAEHRFAGWRAGIERLLM